MQERLKQELLVGQIEQLNIIDYFILKMSWKMEQINKVK